MNQRESRYVKVAKIAYRLTRQALPKYSHAKSSHHFELPQLAACVLMMFYLDVSIAIWRSGKTNATNAANNKPPNTHGMRRSMRNEILFARATIHGDKLTCFIVSPSNARDK